MNATNTETVDIAVAQGRTLRLLFAIQVISGIGVGIGGSVGALLAAELVGVSVSGFVQSASVGGSALLALPAAEIVRRAGRRPSLAASYLIAALGAMLVVIAAVRGVTPLLFAGFFLFGGATAAGLQARYAAVDLAPAKLRGRHLSTIVWATTVGSVAGPNLAAGAGAYFSDYGVPTLAGPFVLSSMLFGLAAVVLMLLMRPDPAVLARTASVSTGSQGSGKPVGVRAALRVIASDPSARLGVTAVAIGHVVMVGVMAMTPVHIRGAGHAAADTLRIVGVVISLHIAGMYALAPLVGWLTDRAGRRPVILAGIVVLLASCALTGPAGHDATRLAIGLTVLGIGWSATMVAGSTLLSESVPVHVRTSAQGLSDLIMGLCGASAAALSGAIVQTWGFPTLTLIAAFATTPLILLALIGSPSRGARITARP